MGTERTGEIARFLDRVDGSFYAHGLDSLVYRKENLAVKVYKQFQGVTQEQRGEQLGLYKEITNKASEMAFSEDWIIKSPKLKWFTTLFIPEILKQDLPVRVNPFDDLFLINGNWIGLSPYIEGDTLKTMESRIDAHNIIVGLSETGEKVNKALELKGVLIDSVNVKIVTNGSGLSLVITDLCPVIEKLKLREQYKNR